MLLNFNHDASSFPSPRVVPGLILDVDMVAYDQRREFPRVLGPPFMADIVPLGEGFLPVIEDLTPCFVGRVPAWKDGNQVLDLPSEHDHCRRYFCGRINGVSVRQYSHLEFVHVQ